MAAKLMGAEATRAKSDLKGAGCPDDVCDQLLTAGADLSLVQRLLAFAQAHGSEIWAIVQLVLSLAKQTP